METIALTREVLSDYARNRLDLDSTVDIQIALHRLERNRGLLVYLYIAGYTTSELAYAFELPLQQVQDEIRAGLLFIGESIGLRDTKLYRHFTQDKLWQARKAKMIEYFRKMTDELDEGNL